LGTNRPDWRPFAEELPKSPGKLDEDRTQWHSWSFVLNRFLLIFAELAQKRLQREGFASAKSFYLF
jgi:hypothetical protein